MTYAILKPCRAVFCRKGYTVALFNDDGTPQMRKLRVQNSGYYGLSTAASFVFVSGPANFYGNDGRKVRAEAIRFARDQGAAEIRKG